MSGGDVGLRFRATIVLHSVSDAAATSIFLSHYPLHVLLLLSILPVSPLGGRDRVFGGRGVIVLTGAARVGTALLVELVLELAY